MPGKSITRRAVQMFEFIYLPPNWHKVTDLMLLFDKAVPVAHLSLRTHVIRFCLIHQQPHQQELAKINIRMREQKRIGLSEQIRPICTTNCYRVLWTVPGNFINRLLFWEIKDRGSHLQHVIGLRNTDQIERERGYNVIHRKFAKLCKFCWAQRWKLKLCELM